MSKILPRRPIEEGSAVAQITIWQRISRFARRNVHVGIQVRSGCQAIVGFDLHANLLAKYYERIYWTKITFYTLFDSFRHHWTTLDSLRPL